MIFYQYKNKGILCIKFNIEVYDELSFKLTENNCTLTFSW